MSATQYADRPFADGSGDPDPLFAFDGTTPETVQWKAETFQLVNWGGFEGRVRFDFHPGATLISGQSGSGKSTLLDAYLALMMPWDTPFNGASNDVVRGRVRGEDQRNLLSYLRGKTDTTTDPETGREVARVLRGNGTATWGAVGMTFVDDHQHRFTATRVYYVPARATRDSDITMRMVTVEGTFDLADLAPLVGDLFAHKPLTATFPGLQPHNTYASFAHTLHTRLGIGANGDGAKALRLLVRIQSGLQIRTVDELYKEMVLEQPPTFGAADRAIEHFDNLEAAYVAMQTEQAKVDLLAPITDLHRTLVTAENEIETLDTFGVTRDGDTPVGLWALRTEETLLETAVNANRSERTASADRVRDARTHETDVRRSLKAVEAELSQQDGSVALARIADDIANEQVLRETRASTRALLAEQVTCLGVPLATREEFDRFRAAADEFLGTCEQLAADLQTRREGVLREQFPLLERKRQIGAELESLAGRHGRVPSRMDDLRREVANVSGLDVADLPFVAELIDVPAENRRWRTAIETVLASAARTMLVPEEHLAAFSTAIDPLQLRSQLRFEGVPRHLPPVDARDPDRAAGKILYADSPYRGWVQAHLTNAARNARCVETAADLTGPGYRVTAAGQTRNGTRGTHGRSDTVSIIGFSSDDAIAELTTELTSVEHQLTTLDRTLAGLDATHRDLGRTRDAYQAVRFHDWDQIDVVGCDERVAALEEERATILASDDQLATLQAQQMHLTDELEEAQQRRFRVEQEASDLDDVHLQLVGDQDRVTADLVRYVRDQRVALDDTQVARLDAEFTAAVAPADPTDLDAFAVNLARLRARLAGTLESARGDLARATGDLERIFAGYLTTWDDPNLGRSVESYPDYARILDDIRTTGLHERRVEWRQRLTTWSGEDLVPLAGAMDAAIEEIDDRLDPINDILRTLPFGARNDRLLIRLRRLSPDHVTVFRKELRVLSSGATREVPEAQMESRFRNLQRFMARIRRKDDPRAAADLGDRARLLDVRKHVEITAERYSRDGALLSTHSALGGKSGGESQELVAFIVGAALRFRLGDELRTRPRFAPVFLDEGFVKSDAEFAGRAVEAWKGLGFQLIVGAPVDKVTALEPHMDEMLAITKNTTTHYSFVHRLTDPTGDDLPAGTGDGTSDGSGPGAERPR